MAPQPASPRRRAGDTAWLTWVKRVVGAQLTDSVSLGRGLVLSTALIYAVTVPLLDLDSDALMQDALVTGIMLAGLLVSTVVPWSRLPERATLAFPALVAGGLAILGLMDVAVFSPLTGVLVVCFAYIGLTQPPRTTIVLLPVAALVLVEVNGTWSSAIAVRTAVACVVWAMVGELIAYFTMQQGSLTDALRAAAHTDALTGIPNRRDLDLRLATASPGDIVVVCDLDHFKTINDVHGHHVGDAVLADFGTMLRTSLRAEDYCARLGGEEFVLVLVATSLTDAHATLTRMRKNWAVLQPDTTFSAGLANCRSDRPHVATLAAADAALYAAKAAGRNCDREETAPVWVRSTVAER